MFVFQTCISFMLLLSALVCLYYWFLLLTIFCSKWENNVGFRDSLSGKARLAIVIPAHNEENVIGPTLQSCQSLEYPADRYDIFVVADNCTDATGQVATGYGVIVLERHDELRKGKGYALAHAFEHLLPQGYEAVIVVDADCLIDSNALQVIDHKLLQGNKILQINNTVDNPDQSIMSYALAVGNFIENNFFYAPKSLLGLAVFLRGTGMVMHRDILLAHPWAAHSIVEDVEYSLVLLKAGHRICFLPEVKVASPFPVDQEQLRVQRTRWASGNLTFGRQAALGLIGTGIRQRKWILIDAGWTFLVLSRPLVLLQLFVTLGATIALYIKEPYTFSQVSMVVVATLVLFFFIYFVLGIVKMGLSRKRLSFLALVPLTVFQLIIISLRGVIGGKKQAWARTPR